MKAIYFSYVVQKNFSGQSRATEQIIEALDLKFFKPIVLNQYSFDRKKNKYKSFFEWVVNTLSISPKLIKVLFETTPIVHLSLGQEWASLLRIIWWYFPLATFKKVNFIISLNGRNFQSWGQNKLIRKVFSWILLKSRIVTVVGPNQKSILLKEFKIPSTKVEIIPNTSDFQCIPNEDFEKKFNNTNSIQVMFLSLLIESKGFVLFLEALLKIVREKEVNTAVKAYLCGTISFTKYCVHFNNSEKEVKDYIVSTIREIEKIAKERELDFELTWINGVRGIEKQNIFHKTHLFVLPTFFPAESQPLVLMEAMSAGCAVVTSKVGEIEYMLGHLENYLSESSVDELAERMFWLIENPNFLKDQAKNNLQRFNENFSIEIYNQSWQKIFNSFI